MNVQNSSKIMVWTGRIISILVILFLLMDSVMKVIRTDTSVEATTGLGYSASTVLWIGLALLVSTILYAVPRTALLGAILVTGYLGGAVATHVRVLDPWLLFPIVIGILVWTGLYLRDSRLRKLVPLRRKFVEDHEQ